MILRPPTPTRPLTLFPYTTPFRSRRHPPGDLRAVLDRLERRAHRDLGLAVADVAADQPVHRHGALHVALDLVDGRQLVGRLVEGERVLERSEEHTSELQ